MTRELEPIIKYKMDSIESKAYKIALMWQDECRREIPKEPYARMKEGSDPRKSILFKYCFKLARETSGIINDPDLQLYIRSQIQVLKSINDGKVHALIEPHCLVGDKAWRRWKLWKSRYDKKLMRPASSPNAQIRPSDGKIRSEMSSTFDFLSKMDCISFSSMSSRSSEIRRWIYGGEVSCYWVVLSPWARKIIGDPSLLDIDYLYYRSSLTPSTEEFFRELFSHEFQGETECQKAS